MYYKLNDFFSLRGWQRIPYILYNLLENNICGILNKDIFELLNMCDGKTNLEESEKLLELCKKNVVISSKDILPTKDIQHYRYYDNRYFDASKISLTNRCNCDCKHCMAGNAKSPYIELTYDDCIKIFDQLQECGIGKVSFTGGEPFLHPDFLKIFEECIKRGFIVTKIYTNALLINEKLLGRLHYLSPKTKIEVSFDGLGFHDWMRNYKGAETIVIEKMKMIIKQGFKLNVTMCLNKKNLDSLFPTIKFISGLGASKMRILFTGSSPKWEKSGGEKWSLSPTEYFDACLSVLQKFLKLENSMCLKFLSIGEFSGNEESNVPCFIVERDHCPILCPKMRNNIFISHDGKVLPCIVFEVIADKFSYNIKKDRLKNILSQSKYLDLVTSNCEDLALQNEKCNSCQWINECTGGCRALAYRHTQDFYGIDPLSCIWFHNGYSEKLDKILSDHFGKQ